MRLETCACLGSVGYLGSAMMLVAGTRTADRIWTPVRLAKRVPGWECVLSFPLGARRNPLRHGQTAATASKRLEFPEPEARTE